MKSIFLLFFLLPLKLVAASVGICAIFQNEAPYFPEWIAFHEEMGVTHFYLYNNCSTDEYSEVLAPYIEEGVVTLIDWPYSYEPSAGGFSWLEIQAGAYTECIHTFGDRHEWIAFIDRDEFLFCPSGEKLPTFLDRFKDYAGVCVNWLFFGTSNIWSLPEDALLTEHLTLRAPLDEPRNYSFKSIVQPKYVCSAKNAHEFRYRYRKYAVDASMHKVDTMPPRSVHFDSIRIHHYWTRTEQHFYEKKIASRRKRRDTEGVEELIELSKKYNSVEDTTILPFLPKVKERLFQKKY